MSICLAQASPPSSQWDLVVSILWALAALYLLLGPVVDILRVRKILGPARLEPWEAVWPVGVVMLLGFCVWYGVSGSYVSFVDRAWIRAGATGDPPPLDPVDNAFLSTVPALAALAVIVLGDVLVHAKLPERLGYVPRRMARGIAFGALAMFVALPVIVVTEGAQEWLMERWHYQHPSEHELLQSLGEAQGHFVKVCIVLGATVAAPLFEEYLFRGHLQTVLRHLLSWRQRATMPTVDPPGFSVSPDPGADLVQTGPQRPPSSWPAWAAVVITSAIFTRVHPTWEWGAIFPLSICLGYVYERTGNLWAAVTTHMLFNAMGTATFLWMK